MGMAPFCPKHNAAPAAQRGGWLSAHRRKAAMTNDVNIDANQIVNRLWVGSKPPFDRHLPAFSMLVLCAEELQPPHIAFRGKLVRCPIYDTNPLPQTHWHHAVRASREVADELRRGGRVLVTCQMGLNRSALVASLAILQTMRMHPAQIIQLVRARRRSNALCNPHFCELLMRAGAPPAPPSPVFGAVSAGAGAATPARPRRR